MFVNLFATALGIRFTEPFSSGNDRGGEKRKKEKKTHVILQFKNSSHSNLYVTSTGSARIMIIIGSCERFPSFDKCSSNNIIIKMESLSLSVSR